VSAVALNARRGAVAGLLGGLAFAGVMEADLALTGNGVDDFRLLGQLGPAARWWRFTGPAAHAVNSAALGAIYARVEGRLPGPPWARGLLFASAENAALWPLVLLVDRLHPAVQRGELASFARWPAFGWEALRHAAYGLALGSAYARLSRRHHG
jgi:hypothetical protein